MNYEEKYKLAWKYLEENNYHEGLNLFQELVKDNYGDAIYDLAGIHYHGQYNLPKDNDKAAAYYEKAFLIKKDRKILRDLMYVQVENIGKTRTLFYILFKKNILSTLAKSQ